MQNGWQKFLDTNIFIYAEDKDNPAKYEVALGIIEKAANEANGMISTQVLAEFSSQMRRVMKAAEVNIRISDYMKVFGVIQYSESEIKEANQISETYKLHFFDALIISTMKANNVETIITENSKDFKKVPWVKVINPFK